MNILFRILPKKLRCIFKINIFSTDKWGDQVLGQNVKIRQLYVTNWHSYVFLWVYIVFFFKKINKQNTGVILFFEKELF